MGAISWRRHTVDVTAESAYDPSVIAVAARSTHGADSPPIFALTL